MKALWKFLTSIRLTIYLLVASTVLVFFGTLDQVHDGIYLTQQRYFEHLFVVWSYPRQWIFADALGWIHLPMPAGYLLGPLLVVNLLAAHFRYYRAGWRKFGIALLHLGVVGLLVGQLVAQVAQEDNFMWLGEGQKSPYLESFHEDELVVIDRSDPEHDRVYSWPAAALHRAPLSLSHPELPFRVEVEDYMLNAAIGPQDRMPQAPELGITDGVAAQFGFSAFEIPPTYAQDERNRKTAIVELHAPNEAIGRWMVSNVFRPQVGSTQNRFEPQTFTYEGRTYEIALRYKRTYLPAEIELIDFSHDRYPGTQIPFNFSSEVRLIESGAANARTNLIYMNHPMRFAGHTFYQASFANNDTMSMFQVVRNPGRWVPYIACLLITLGMVWQFTWSLVVFALRSRRSSSPSAS